MKRGTASPPGAQPLSIRQYARTEVICDVLKIIAEEIIDWVEVLLAAIPGRTGVRLRLYWWRNRLGPSGRNFSISRNCTIVAPGNISLGEAVSFGDSCHLGASGGRLAIGAKSAFNRNVFIGADFGEIEIGRDALVGMNVVFRSSNHRFESSPDVPMREQGHAAGRILIGDDVWIGANVTIVAGATIGSHSVIGAGSVVTSEIPPNSIAAGIPAKVIRSLKL